MLITVGIVDDKALFVGSMTLLINQYGPFQTILEAHNGDDALRRLVLATELPDILLIDVEMPGRNGIDTAREISKKYPAIKLAALSQKDDDTTVINMLKAGCCAYLLKDIHPQELEKALLEIHSKGFYNGDAFNVNSRRLIIEGKKMEANTLSKREIEFITMACSDLTYRQIAAKMFLSERTIDGYRESVFEKMQVQSRVGMALEAIRRKIVSV